MLTPITCRSQCQHKHFRQLAPSSSGEARNDGGRTEVRKVGDGGVLGGVAVRNSCLTKEPTACLKKKKKPSWFSTSCSSVLSCTISEGHFSESRWRKILYLKSGRVTEVQRVLSIYSWSPTFPPRKKAFHGYRFQGRERIFAFKWDGEVRGGRLTFEGEMQLRGGENSRLQRKSRTAGGAGGRDGADGAATLNLGVSFSASWLTPVGGETRWDSSQGDARCEMMAGGGLVLCHVTWLYLRIRHHHLILVSFSFLLTKYIKCFGLKKCMHDSLWSLASLKGNPLWLSISVIPYLVLWSVLKTDNKHLKIVTETGRQERVGKIKGEVRQITKEHN